MDEIIYPFPNCSGVAVEVWEWISYFIPQFTWMLELKLICVSKNGSLVLSSLDFPNMIVSLRNCCKKGHKTSKYIHHHLKDWEIRNTACTCRCCAIACSSRLCTFWYSLSKDVYNESIEVARVVKFTPSIPNLRSALQRRYGSGSAFIWNFNHMITVYVSSVW